MKSHSDLLAALRETPGCGEDPECITRHTLAVHHADECNPCLTRLAEAVLNHYDWPSLLAALRSETPR